MLPDGVLFDVCHGVLRVGALYGASEPLVMRLGLADDREAAAVYLPQAFHGGDRDDGVVWGED